MEEPEEIDQDEITVEYVEGQQTPTIAFTGAYGGLTPDHAHIVAHLYVIHGSVPDAVRYDVEAGGRVDLGAGDPEMDTDMTREIQGKLLMSLESARRFHDWLGEKIELLERARQAPEEGATEAENEN